MKQSNKSQIRETLTLKPEGYSSLPLCYETELIFASSIANKIPPSYPHKLGAHEGACEKSLVFITVTDFRVCVVAFRSNV